MSRLSQHKILLLHWIRCWTVINKTWYDRS